MDHLVSPGAVRYSISLSRLCIETEGLRPPIVGVEDSRANYFGNNAMRSRIHENCGRENTEILAVDVPHINLFISEEKRSPRIAFDTSRLGGRPLGEARNYPARAPGEHRQRGQYGDYPSTRFF